MPSPITIGHRRATATGGIWASRNARSMSSLLVKGRGKLEGGSYFRSLVIIVSLSQEPFIEMFICSEINSRQRRMTLNLTVSLGLFCKQNTWLWRIYKEVYSGVTAPVSGESKQHGTDIYEDPLAMHQHGRRTEREPPFCRESQAHKVTLLPPKPTQWQKSQLTLGSHCSPLGPASFQEPSTSAPLPDEVSLWTWWQHTTVKWQL